MKILLYKQSYSSPIGELVLNADETTLKGLWMRGQKRFGQNGNGTVMTACSEQSNPVLQMASKWLDDYFAGKAPRPQDLPLWPEGSVFQKRVWTLLCEIPCGETVTYGALAKKLAAEQGKPRLSAQAVGGAVGRNPIVIIIPCHRVIGADGSLTGYAGGLAAKEWLLKLEGSRYGRSETIKKEELFG